MVAGIVGLGPRIDRFHLEAGRLAGVAHEIGLDHLNPVIGRVGLREFDQPGGGRVEHQPAAIAGKGQGLDGATLVTVGSVAPEGFAVRQSDAENDVIEGNGGGDEVVETLPPGVVNADRFERGGPGIYRA